MIMYKNASKTRKIGTLSMLLPSLLVGMLVFFYPGKMLYGTESSGTASKDHGRRRGDSQVVVTYFYTNVRCPTCRKLETYSRESVETAFAQEIKDKVVLFRAVNVDEPENKHYIKDFKLYTKSLVVALTRKGEVVHWKNLPEIWKHVRDRPRFEEYVQTGVKEFLKDL